MRIWVLGCVAVALLSSSACLFKKKGADDPEGNVVAGETNEGVDDGPLRYEPDLQWDEMTFQDRSVIYFVPENPRGLVYAFHGTGTSVDYVTRIETVAVLNELVAAGFGFVGTSSTDRQSKQWDVDSADLDSNEDLQVLFDLRDELIDSTDLTDDSPVFAFGFSNGGGMSGVLAIAALDAGWPMRATAPHLSGGMGYDLDGFPMLWVIADNDPQPAAESLIESRSGPTEVYRCHVEPIDALYFMRNPKVSEGESTRSQEAMVDLELLDADFFPGVPLEEFESYLHLYETDGGSLGAVAPTSRTEEIRVAWAMHRMSGLYAKEVRDFFIEHQ
jgi:hypothetical protein